MIDLEETQELEPVRIGLDLARAGDERTAYVIHGSLYNHAKDYERSPLFHAALEFMTPDRDRLAILAKLRQRYPQHTAEQLNQAVKETCVTFAAAGVWPQVKQ